MSFFQTQATLPLDAPSYVPRKADQELFEGLSQGEFCYVLTSRQMGKSSLMVRTAQRLRDSGCSVVMVDLQGVGFNNITAEQWYDGLVVKIGRQLKLENELEDFWLDNDRIGPVQRLFTALREVVLPALPAPAPPEGQTPKLVLFVDEIDMVRSLPFPTDEFFAAIRECFNTRTDDGSRLPITFALLGVATPAELIRDPSLTPFNIGRRIELTDFTALEAAPFVRGLGRPKNEAQALLQRVLRWTNGHPYLTQCLCHALASDPLLDAAADVDRLCEDTFLSRRAIERDENLLFVRERLLRTGTSRANILRLYERVLTRKNVPDDELDPLSNALRLSGIVRVERGLLVLRNRIYGNVFDRDWLHQTLESVGEIEAATIAVLPFVDLSVDNSEYLSDGLTDELINALGKIPNLRVASRTSSFQFKGRTGDIRQIGAQLGVSLVLEGNLRRLGRRVRVTTQLISVADGRSLWSGSFKYSVDDIHMIQEEIARTFVDHLNSYLGQPIASTTHRKPPDRDAYQEYLKGRYLWNRRNENSVRRSVRHFETAIAKDPEFAAAHAGLADAQIVLGIYNFQPPLEVLPKAKEAAIRALEIDPDLADAHSAMGCVHSVYDWDWVKAEKSFQRAINLNPSDANAHLWYGINCLSPLGRHEEALAELRRAQEVDPLSIRIAASIGFALHLADRNDEALAQCRYTIELDDSFWLTYHFLGCILLREGLHSEATQAFQSSVDLSQGDAAALAAFGQCLAVQNRAAEAQRILDGLLNLGRVRYVPASEIATIYAGLRQMDLARQWMDRAHKERAFRLIYLRVDPRFADFRDA